MTPTEKLTRVLAEGLSVEFAKRFKMVSVIGPNMVPEQAPTAPLSQPLTATLLDQTVDKNIPFPTGSQGPSAG